MCYSAQIRADFSQYVRRYGADINIKEFIRLYWLRDQGSKIRIPKAVDAAFAHPRSEDEARIRDLIDVYNTREAARLERELFKQRKRLADAERSLANRHTKSATESRRIAKDKVEWSLRKLADLRRTELVDSDSRIFPGWYAPVITEIDGRRMIMPMRYQCRLAGKPAAYDYRFPGTYNARRDNLEGFWRAQFGTTHAIMVVNAFYENVARHAMEARELAPSEKPENVVLEFRPRPDHDMLVACLWSRWQAGDEDLYSFAAITDQPPAEVAAAGHDRCIVPITEASMDAWLRPVAGDTSALYAILDDRDRPYYEHRLAA